MIPVKRYAVSAYIFRGGIRQDAGAKGKWPALHERTKKELFRCKS
jgi:hypothetical protein